MTGLKRLLKWQSMRRGISTEQATATGNPATFETELRRDLTGLVVPFTPVQAGSGAPSPENVRPITGWTGVNVYHSGEDTSDPTVYPVSWQTEAGTVYGGELNIITGILTVQLGKITVNEVEWTYESNYSRFQTSVDGIVVKTAARATPFYSECFISVDDMRPLANVPNNAIYAASNTTRIFVKTTDYSDADDFTEALGTMAIIYPLATPLTYNITPQQIKTLLSENVIWTDTNGTNTIKYLKKG